MPFKAIGVAHVLPVKQGELEPPPPPLPHHHTTPQGKQCSPSQKQPGTSHFTLANSKLSLPNMTKTAEPEATQREVREEFFFSDHEPRNLGTHGRIRALGFVLERCIACTDALGTAHGIPQVCLRCGRPSRGPASARHWPGIDAGSRNAFATTGPPFQEKWIVAPNSMCARLTRQYCVPWAGRA